MSNVISGRAQGKPSTIYEYFNWPLDRAEALRATWLDYRVRCRKFEIDPTLASEVRAVSARDAWQAAWRAANPS